jgi:tartrate dehydrogenase/decarboxylase/D-malate dehydrogenase
MASVYWPANWNPAANPGTRPRRIAVIPGDGIGPEVVNGGRQVIQHIMQIDPTVQLTVDEFPWSSAYFRAHGRMMPPDGLDILRDYDAIYFGAVGDPALPPDVPVWGLILPIRQALQLSVNLRPIRYFPGVRSVLKELPADGLDIIIVRENTEGEYAGQGGWLFPKTPREVALQVAVYSRPAIEQVVRYAFELARRLHKRCTSISKANALNYAGRLWDTVFEEIGRDYPDVKRETVLVDAAALYLVMQPQRFEIMVTPNLFGDILSDLGAGLVGGLGLAASANFNPAGGVPGFFEPVHGSAPDIAGRGIANPLAAIWAAAMMLGYLGYNAWEEKIVQAMATLLAASEVKPVDLGGHASTQDVVDALIALLSR